jgi:hypothetical protein
LLALLPATAETPVSKTSADKSKLSAKAGYSAPARRSSSRSGEQDHSATFPDVVEVPAADAKQAGVDIQYVEERLAVWQQRLDLEDWRISVRVTRREDLKPKTLGGIRWDKRKKSAVIWVLDPSDYELSHPEMLQDLERTIVHELLHLELSSRRRSEASRSHEESAVNRIAEAFLKLDRKNK